MTTKYSDWVGVDADGTIVLRAINAGDDKPIVGSDIRLFNVENANAAALPVDYYKSFPRDERDKRLQASDWTQLPDAQANLSEEKLAEWTAYRQALRDLPDNSPDPLDIDWPEIPA